MPRVKEAVRVCNRTTGDLTLWFPHDDSTWWDIHASDGDLDLLQGDEDAAVRLSHVRVVCLWAQDGIDHQVIGVVYQLHLRALPTAQYNLVIHSAVQPGYPQRSTTWLPTAQYNLVIHSAVQPGYPKRSTTWLSTAQYNMVIHSAVQPGYPQRSTTWLSTAQYNLVTHSAVQPGYPQCSTTWLSTAQYNLVTHTQRKYNLVIHTQCQDNLVIHTQRKNNLVSPLSHKEGVHIHGHKPWGGNLLS